MLCSICSRIFRDRKKLWPKDNPWYGCPWYSHHKSVYLLSESAAEGCQLCSQFLRVFTRVEKPSDFIEDSQVPHIEYRLIRSTNYLINLTARLSYSDEAVEYDMRWYWSWHVFWLADKQSMKDPLYEASMKLIMKSSILTWSWIHYEKRT